MAILGLYMGLPLDISFIPREGGKTLGFYHMWDNSINLEIFYLARFYFDWFPFVIVSYYLSNKNWVTSSIKEDGVYEFRKPLMGQVEGLSSWECMV